MSFGMETSTTYVNFDLLLRSQRNQDEFRAAPPDPRSLLCACTRSAAEPDKVYPQWPLSFLVAYLTVPYNGRYLLVEPEVGPFLALIAPLHV